MITIWQAIELFVLILVAWWAIKQLFLHYLLKYLEYKRYCLKCLTMNEDMVAVNADWQIFAEDKPLPIFLCNKCKEEDFPGELGETAEKHGLLVRRKI